MAWQFPVTTNTSVDLGATDNVYVAEGVLVGTQDTAILGAGTTHIVEVYGTVISAFEGMVLGTSASSANQISVQIGASGHVITKFSDSTGAAAVALLGGGGSVVNDGEISSTGYGVFITATTADRTTVINHGTIEANCGIAPRGTDITVARLINDGTIAGVEKSYGQNAAQDISSPTSTKDLITNKGLMIGDITLNGGDDVYDGLSGTLRGAVYGGAGSDRIYGGSEKNAIFGGAGADAIGGGKGADTLAGGGGPDSFIFQAIIDSTIAAKGARDTIMDFNHAQNDRIDLHLLDADADAKGNQGFHFIQSQAFHQRAGELRFENASGNTYVYGDTDGDGKADFAIKLEGVLNLAAGDFSL